jgi:hypothetical protein
MFDIFFCNFSWRAFKLVTRIQLQNTLDKFARVKTKQKKKRKKKLSTFVTSLTLWNISPKKEEKEEKTIENSHGLWNKDCCLFLLSVVVAVAVVNEIQKILFFGFVLTSSSMEKIFNDLIMFFFSGFNGILLSISQLFLSSDNCRFSYLFGERDLLRNKLKRKLNFLFSILITESARGC